MRKSLSRNLLDEWLDIMEARTMQDYAGFKEDLQALTEHQADKDTALEQKKKTILEKTKKLRSMKRKEQIDWIKFIINYLLQMKRSKGKYLGQGLVENFNWNTIPET